MGTDAERSPPGALLEDPRVFMGGLSDESGASPALAMASKQLGLPVAGEVYKLEEYVHGTLWAGRDGKRDHFVQGGDHSVRLSMLHWSDKIEADPAPFEAFAPSLYKTCHKCWASCSKKRDCCYWMHWRASHEGRGGMGMGHMGHTLLTRHTPLAILAILAILAHTCHTCHTCTIRAPYVHHTCYTCSYLHHTYSTTHTYRTCTILAIRTYCTAGRRSTLSRPGGLITTRTSRRSTGHSTGWLAISRPRSPAARAGDGIWSRRGVPPSRCGSLADGGHPSGG